MAIKSIWTNNKDTSIVVITTLNDNLVCGSKTIKNLLSIVQMFGNVTCLNTKLHI